MSLTSALIGTVLVTAAAVTPGVAFACGTQPTCQEAKVTPAAGLIPADLSELFVYGPAFQGSGTSAQVTVRELHGLGTTVLSGRRVFGEQAIAFSEPLTPGKRYEVTVTSFCADQTSTVTTSELLVEETSPAPTSLGSLSVRERGGNTGSVALDSCGGQTVGAVVEVQLDLEGMSEGWRNGLREVELLVDGFPNAKSAAIPPFFSVHTRCEGRDAYDLKLGKHTVLVRAELPGAVPSSVESAPLEVNLSCADAAQDIAATQDPDPAAAEAEGCSLAVGGGGQGACWSLAAFGLLVGARRSRRGARRGERS